eukprot:TRINITY_DN3539_c0_g1_i1.p1 TRINITY_DN3539_c0_g1~~TRINITY_DN3539_c0_g1_i1.p1  ORF type:complete len:771 (+),score=148.84 TRINITY_DN3539_c0_g1_i1:98-2410(+)
MNTDNSAAKAAASASSSSGASAALPLSPSSSSLPTGFHKCPACWPAADSVVHQAEELYWLQFQPKQALQVLEEALKEAPECSLVLCVLANVYRYLGHLLLARTMVDCAYFLDSEDVRILYSRARILAEAAPGDLAVSLLEEAEAKFAALAQLPMHEEIITQTVFLRILALTTFKNYGLALHSSATFAPLLFASRYRLETKFRHATGLFELGNYEAGLNFLTELMNDADLNPTQRMFALWQRGRMLQGCGNIVGAIHDFQEAGFLSSTQEHAVTSFEAIVAAWRSMDDFPSAQSTVDEALEQFPASARLLETKARILHWVSVQPSPDMLNCLRLGCDAFVRSSDAVPSRRLNCLKFYLQSLLECDVSHIVISNEVDRTVVDLVYCVLEPEQCFLDAFNTIDMICQVALTRKIGEIVLKQAKDFVSREESSLYKHFCESEDPLVALLFKNYVEQAFHLLGCLSLKLGDENQSLWCLEKAALTSLEGSLNLYYVRHFAASLIDCGLYSAASTLTQLPIPQLQKDKTIRLLRGVAALRDGRYSEAMAAFNQERRKFRIVNPACVSPPPTHDALEDEFHHYRVELYSKLSVPKASLMMFRDFIQTGPIKCEAISDVLGGACPSSLNCLLTKSGVTPLMECSKLGLFELASFLLDQRVDVNHFDIHGRTSVTFALIHRQFQVLILLLSRGALCDGDDLQPFHTSEHFETMQIAVRLGRRAWVMREELYRQKLLDVVEGVCGINIGSSISNLICEYTDTLPSWINLDHNAVVFQCLK